MRAVPRSTFRRHSAAYPQGMLSPGQVSAVTRKIESCPANECGSISLGRQSCAFASSVWRLKASTASVTRSAMTHLRDSRRDRRSERPELAVLGGHQRVRRLVPARSGSGCTSGAPCAIQFASLSISAAPIGFTPAFNSPAFGGIAPDRTFSTMMLSSGRPTTNAGPDLSAFERSMPWGPQIEACLSLSALRGRNCNASKAPELHHAE